jgi:hypothetical protein
MSAFDGGAKPNLYSVNVSCPALGNAFQNLQFFCRATTLPSSQLGEIVLPYLGRMAKYPGDRFYDPWSITVINTQDMQLRKVFEYWNELFNSHAGNVSASTNPRQLFGGATITQLARNYQPVRSYFLAEVYPSAISPVGMGFADDNVISEFEVTLTYSYFITDTSAAVNGVGIFSGNPLANPGAIGGGAPAGAIPAFGGVGGLGGGFGLPGAFGQSSSGGFSFQNKNFGFSIGGSNSSFGSGIG